MKPRNRRKVTLFTRHYTSYYYVRGEQEDGELVWISPVWIHLTAKP